MFKEKKTSLSDENKAKQTKKLKWVSPSSKTPGQNESAPLPGEPHHGFWTQHRRGWAQWSCGGSSSSQSSTVRYVVCWILNFNHNFTRPQIAVYVYPSMLARPCLSSHTHPHVSFHAYILYVIIHVFQTSTYHSSITQSLNTCTSINFKI